MCKFWPRFQTGCCGSLETLCKVQACYLMIVCPITIILSYTGHYPIDAFPVTKGICDPVYAVAAVIYLVGICKRRPGLLLPIVVLFHIGIITSVAFEIWVLCAHGRPSRYWGFFLIDSVIVFFFMLCANSLYHDYKERSDSRSADEASKC